MSRKGESVTISLTEFEKKELEIIAFELGFKWGEKGNISSLMKAIALREIPIGKSDESSDFKNKEQRIKKRVAAIEKIKRGLDELGKLL